MRRQVLGCCGFAFALFILLLVYAPHFIPVASAQTGTPPSSTISSSSGPLVWDFAPVGGGTVTNVGIQDICPPGMCDDHDLTIVLPAPAATFYQTMTAQVTFKYTWTSTLPTDLDIFAISPNGADHGPGSPDNTSTGPGEEDLTLTDPLPGLWHIRSVASLVPIPVAAHVVVTMTIAPRPTTPPPPPPGILAFTVLAALLTLFETDCPTLRTPATESRPIMNNNKAYSIRSWPRLSSHRYLSHRRIFIIVVL